MLQLVKMYPQLRTQLLQGALHRLCVLATASQATSAAVAAVAPEVGSGSRSAAAATAAAAVADMDGDGRAGVLAAWVERLLPVTKKASGSSSSGGQKKGKQQQQQQQEGSATASLLTQHLEVEQLQQLLALALSGESICLDRFDCCECLALLWSIVK